MYSSWQTAQARSVEPNVRRCGCGEIGEGDGGGGGDASVRDTKSVCEGTDGMPMVAMRDAARRGRSANVGDEGWKVGNRRVQSHRRGRGEDCCCDVSEGILEFRAVMFVTFAPLLMSLLVKYTR